MFDPAKYVNSFPYPSEGYREEESKIYKRFKEDLFSFLEIHGNPKAEMLFDKAWYHGHASGYDEVWYWATDLVELIQ